MLVGLPTDMPQVITTRVEVGRYRQDRPGTWRILWCL